MAEKEQMREALKICLPGFVIIFVLIFLWGYLWLEVF
jgi:hypothetical protein